MLKGKILTNSQYLSPSLRLRGKESGDLEFPQARCRRTLIPMSRIISRSYCVPRSYESLVAGTYVHKGTRDGSLKQSERVQCRWKNCVRPYQHSCFAHPQHSSSASWCEENRSVLVLVRYIDQVAASYFLLKYPLHRPSHVCFFFTDVVKCRKSSLITLLYPVCLPISMPLITGLLTHAPITSTRQATTLRSSPKLVRLMSRK